MRKRKTWDELGFTDDYMFKKIMVKYPKLCKKITEVILGTKISSINYLEAEKTVDNAYDAHGVRFDVYIEDDESTVYNIEMQVRDYGAETLAKRLRYYQSSMDVDALDAGNGYEALKKSYVIFLCPFPFLDGRRHKYTFRNCCIEDHNLVLQDGAIKIVLSSRGTLDDVPAELMELLNYMNDRCTPGDIAQEINRAVDDVKVLEKERVAYMTYMEKLREEYSEGREEGREEGHNELNDCYSWLVANNRQSEMLAALNDAVLREKLFTEYSQTNL